MNDRPIPKTYEVRYLPKAAMVIDGVADEPDWQKAAILDDFCSPWTNSPAPRTTFRALCDDEFLYLAYDVQDDDIVVVDSFQNKLDVVKEDRVEIFFALEPELRQYYCLEIDPLGRTLDYAAQHYRHMDREWTCAGLQTGASFRPGGYVVEAAIPLATLRELGLPALDSPEGVLAGVYRAEFFRGDHGETLESWMSWVDPRTPEPDFHVPTSFGRFRMVGER